MPGPNIRPTASAHSGTIPDLALSDEIERLFNASMSVNTSQAYKMGIQAFDQFCTVHGLTTAWPPLDTHLYMFIAHLSIKGYKHSTAKSYIAAIIVNSKGYMTQQKALLCKNYYKA